MNKKNWAIRGTLCAILLMAGSCKRDTLQSPSAFGELVNSSAATLYSIHYVNLGRGVTVGVTDSVRYFDLNGDDSPYISLSVVYQNEAKCGEMFHNIFVALNTSDTTKWLSSDSVKATGQSLGILAGFVYRCWT